MRGKIEEGVKNDHLKPRFAKWLEEDFGEVVKFNDPPWKSEMLRQYANQ